MQDYSQQSDLTVLFVELLCRINNKNGIHEQSPTQKTADERAGVVTNCDCFVPWKEK